MPIKLRRYLFELALSRLHGKSAGDDGAHQGDSGKHLRYKIAAWLRGLIPSCQTRPPMPQPKREEIAPLSRLLEAARIPLIQPAAADLA